MKNIIEIQKKRLASIQANSYTTETVNKEPSNSYECDICNDREWILTEGNVAAPCKCQEIKKYNRILKRSGVSEAFQKKGFNNFNSENRPITVINAKDMAISYVKRFKYIKDDRSNSIAFLGQAGSGKTHLSIAIANNLMAKYVGVLYMQYREVITNLKQLIGNEEMYQKEISKYKNASVLLIDDLFKKATFRNSFGHEVLNDSDARIMFEIINHRYLKGLPMIISSEYKTYELVNFDEAIGSRLIEMAKGHIIELDGKELNYRLAIN
jgi:DNA replication protein DnaC